MNLKENVASIIINVIKSNMDGMGHKHALGPRFTKKKNWFRDRVGSRTYLGWLDSSIVLKWINENSRDVKEWTSVKVTNVLNECLLA
jgi:hypothetical protein